MTEAHAANAITVIFMALGAAIGWVLFAHIAKVRLPSLRCELGIHAWKGFAIIKLHPIWHQIPMRRCERCGLEQTNWIRP